jgi:hypothetical protein
LTDQPLPPEPAVNPPMSPLRRLGCAVALIFWFALLMLPCFFFALLRDGEIVLSQGDIPGQELRVWLLSESDERGFGLSRPVVIQGDDFSRVCVETHVDYYLWAGEGEPTSYCECYVRDITAEMSPWLPTEGTCAAP